jgi:hypothetical protein
MRVSIWSVWRICWGIRVWLRLVGITYVRCVPQCPMRSGWTLFSDQGEPPPRRGVG